MADLSLRDRHVAVLGDDPAFIHTLLDTTASISVFCEDASASLRDLAERGLISLHARTMDMTDIATVDVTVNRTRTTTPTTTRPFETRGSVTLVGAGPGDPGLITVAGAAALADADVVVTDRLVPYGLLAESDARIIDVAKIPRGDSTPQETINETLIAEARAGHRVVRFKGGDNFVFGRGGEELEACADAGIAVRVIPGVTSAIAGPALAGIPVTHRGVTQGFTVITGHLAPGHAGSTIDFAALARGGTTIVVLMGVRTLPLIAAALIDAGMSAATPAATVADAGLPSQRTVRATLGSIAAATDGAHIVSPAITIIGEVVDVTSRIDAHCLSPAGAFGSIV